MFTRYTEIKSYFSTSDTLDQVWQYLNTSSQTIAVETLLQVGGKDGLPLTIAAAKGLDFLRDQNVLKYADLLLPLMTTPTQDVSIYLDKWLTGPDSSFKSHAHLIKCELSKTITEEAVPHLIKLYEDDNDRSKYRVEILLNNGNRTVAKENRLHSVSKLGKGVLELLAEDYLQKIDDPSAAIPFIYLSVDIIHDDRKLLANWIHEAGSGSEQSEKALVILKYIQLLTPDTWPLFRKGIEQAPFKVKKALLKSFFGILGISISNKSYFPEKEWKQFEKILPTLPKKLTKHFFGLENRYDAIVKVVIEDSQVDTEETNKSLTERSNERLEKLAVNLKNVIENENSFREIKKNLKKIADSYWYITGGKDERIYKAALKVKDETTFKRLIEWLLDSLSESYNDKSDALPLRESLLTIISVLANRMPDTFASHILNLSKTKSIDPASILVNTVIKHRTWYGINAALNLLQYLPRLPENIYKAISKALKNLNCQPVTLKLLPNFRNIHRKLLPQLISGLDHSSGILAGSSAKLLSSLAASPSLSSSQRKEILTALAKSIQKSSSFNGGYILQEGPSRSPGNIEFTGFLNSTYYQALLQASGQGDDQYTNPGSHATELSSTQNTLKIFLQKNKCQPIRIY